MRITSVELHPEGSSFVCVLSLRDPNRQNPYNVKQILGLDADSIISRFYGTSSDGRKKFYNQTLEKRDIVFDIELNPEFTVNQSYSSLRDEIYRIISSSRSGDIAIQFKDGNDVVAVISGLVQKMEAAIFDKRPGIALTIVPSYPMLRAPNPVLVDVSGLDPALTNIQDPLSTAPHGLTFELSFTAPAPSFVIRDPEDESWSFQIDPVDGFLAGDVLHFSSEYNNKYLYLVRGTDTLYLADVIVAGSVFPYIFPGDNRLSVDPSASVDWVSITHYPTYWGV